MPTLPGHDDSPLQRRARARHNGGLPAVAAWRELTEIAGGYTATAWMPAGRRASQPGLSSVVGMGMLLATRGGMKATSPWRPRLGAGRLRYVRYLRAGILDMAIAPEAHVFGSDVRGLGRRARLGSGVAQVSPTSRRAVQLAMGDAWSAQRGRWRGILSPYMRVTHRR